MPRLVFDDDCLTPEKTIRIDFKGPNPFRFYGEIIGIIRDVLEIRRLNIYEREFRWEIGGDPRPFFYRVFARKPYDQFTNAFFEFVFQGKQPLDVTKDGEMVIFMSPKLKTEFPQSTAWQKSSIYKSLRWVYLRVFYNDARRYLLNDCVRYSNIFVSRIQKMLGISPPMESPGV